MIIVLDTNILLASLGSRSPYRPIFNALIFECFQLAVSNEILSEYAEVIEAQNTSTVSENVLRVLTNLPTLKLVHPSYRWQLIIADPDDDKFVDCALAAQANYLVTDDKHFDVLKTTKFPKVSLLNGEAFIELLKEIA